jgi:hypothetical protein
MARPLLLLVCLPLWAWADSPLTSIDFSRAYAGTKGVLWAAQGRAEQLNGFLLGPAPNDEKLATASALGLERDVPRAFFSALAKAHGKTLSLLEVSELTPSQQFIAGYLLARSRPHDLAALEPAASGLLGARPNELLELAAFELPDDFAVQFVAALVRAQAAFEDTARWCEVFTATNDVMKRFPVARRNVKAAAVDAAQRSLAGYEEYCPGSRAATRKRVAELNQVYTVALLGAQVVVGTQGGVVVWNAKTPTPVATRPGFICHTLTWRGAVWAGCEGEVVSWDGERFTPFLPRATRSSGQTYRPMVIDGQLWVRLGNKTWAFDEAQRAFTVVDTPWSTEVFDAIFFDRAVWWVDFMKGVHVARGEPTQNVRFALRSPEYPGADPRRLRVDESGTLWAEDFESGLYHLEKNHFVPHPGLKDQATGVAIDVARKRRWLLHYTKGLVLQREGQPDEAIALPELSNMRDFCLEPGTGDVWVAGWGQLMRIHQRTGVWVKTRFRVR